MLVYAGQRTQCTLLSTCGYSMLQYVAVRCRVLQSIRTSRNGHTQNILRCNTLQHTATYCNTLQRNVPSCIASKQFLVDVHADDSRPIFTFLITFAFISYFTSKYYRENTASNTQTVQIRISSIY